MLIINHNSDCTAFCTILEALDVGTARCVVMRWAYQLGTSHDHTSCHQKITDDTQNYLYIIGAKFHILSHEDLAKREMCQSEIYD